MHRPADDHRRAYLPDRIWDGVAAGAVADRALLVDGRSIVAVAARAEVPPGFDRLPLPGCTIIPGLIDTHVHYAASFGPAFLAAGVTTVRDVGGDLDWILGQRESLRKRGAIGPRLLCCGFALDGPAGIWNHIVRRHRDAAELRASIREHADRGVDAIKLYAGLTPDLVRAGVTEAHARGLFVLSHLNETSAKEAADADLDEIEHFSRCDVAWRTAADAEDDALIDRFLSRGMVMNPTLVIWDRLGRAHEHAFLHDSRRTWIHPELLAICNAFPYRRCEPAKRLRYQALMPTLKRFLARCHRRDVTLIAGTDTPFMNLLPGFGLHDELAHYVDAGIPAVETLRCATSTAARVLGLGDRIGRLAPGFEADFVAVQGDPLQCIDDLARVRCVVREGVRHLPSALLEVAHAAHREPLEDPIVRDLRTYVAGDMPTYSQK
jgi:imidazolonepropionase-like amidohydrolase